METVEGIWKAESLDRMADNDRVIESQKSRIEVLEFNLEKLRALIYEGYMKTAGIAPAIYEPDAKPKKARKNAVT